MADQKPLIVMRSGPIPGSSYYLDKDEVFLGRDLSNDVAIPDAEISRRHARIITRPEGIFVEDLGSTNGTFLNGARLTAPHLLSHGDLITLAENTVISFETSQAQVQATPPIPLYSPEVSKQSAAPSTPLAQQTQMPTPQQQIAPAKTVTPPKKRSGFVNFMLILIIILVIIALVLTFMPTSWWCALSFNQLYGCPVN